MAIGLFRYGAVRMIRGAMMRRDLFPSMFARIARLGPLARIAVWLLATVAAAGCIQVAALGTGLDFSILAKSGGSGVLIAVALLLLLAIVGADSRPTAAYGLVADRNWLRHGGGGFLVGVAVYGGYCAVVCLVGVFTWQLNEVTPSRFAKSLLAGATTPLVAVTQQIIFAGFLLGMLRERHRRWLAVCVPAALFAVACCLPKFEHTAIVELAPLAVGMFLVAVLLGIVRLRMGNIAFGSGALAGAICVRKVIAKSHVVGFDHTSPLADWLAPGGDPRQAAAFWAVLAFWIAVAAVLLARRGEQQPATVQSNASFKRVMPFSNLLALAPLDLWLVQLAGARFRVGLKYVPRLVVTLFASTVSTLLSLPERLIAPLVMKHDVPPPVFIVGMSRSGTTHLHNLLALDPQFRSPRNYEVFNPHGFLSGWLTTLVMAPILSWRRPMDGVAMGVASPQEEEFALAGMGAASPYWSFVFPRRIETFDEYWAPAGWTPRSAARWECRYRLFLRKITWWCRRRPLLKNPANTGRVAWLARLFPGAKFVHIHRHPFAVVRSNVHLAQHGLVVFQLQDPDPRDSYETRLLPRYRRLIDTFYRDAATLTPGDVADVRFEDLEHDPVAAIEGLYQQLGLTMTDDFRRRLVAYLNHVAGYRKNTFDELPAEERACIVAVMGPYFERWGYDAVGATLPRDVSHAA